MGKHQSKEETPFQIKFCTKCCHSLLEFKGGQKGGGWVTPYNRAEDVSCQDPRAGQHRCLKAATLIQRPRPGGRNDTLCPGAASGIVGDPTAAFQNCLNQRQEVRKGWLLLPGLPDSQTHLGWRPLVMEAALVMEEKPTHIVLSVSHCC